jgi:hypothetical protein
MAPSGTYLAPPDPDAEHPSEPLVKRAAIVGVVTAALDAGIAFGLRVTDTQEAKLLALTSLLAPAILAAWARRSVFSPRSVKALIAAAKNGR